MYSEDDIYSAIAAGILSDDDARAFRKHVEQKNKTLLVDEEHFRLVTGFSDVFVVIAVLMLIIPLSLIGTSVIAWFGPLLVAIASWLLSEFFTRRRRMALPSIVLLITFIAGVFTLTQFLVKSDDLLIAEGAVCTIAAFLHWHRFKVPITIAAGSIFAAGTCSLLIAAAAGLDRSAILIVSLMTGIIIFALAMYWDISDRNRLTRRSDVAFWLHLFASPLLIHPIFSYMNMFGQDINQMQAFGAIVLYILLAIVSLVIDRRALMVSALAYVLYAFSSIVEAFGFVSLKFSFTAFVIGLALILLSAFWHPCRKSVLNLLPISIQLHLPPTK